MPASHSQSKYFSLNGFVYIAFKSNKKESLDLQKSTTRTNTKKKKNFHTKHTHCETKEKSFKIWKCVKILLNNKFILHALRVYTTSSYTLNERQIEQHIRNARMKI